MEQKQLKIALIGYGRMGRLIDCATTEKGIEVTARVNTKSGWDQLKVRDSNETIVCIDFSHPDAVLDNVRIVAEKGFNIVMGTTGWEKDFDRVKDLVKESHIGFMFSPNFSIGINLFVQMIKQAALLINDHPMYDAAVAEIHHRKKVDAPSGTALWIGDTLLQSLSRKKTISDQAHISPEELQISSQRCGDHPGTHIVTFDSLCDTITLKHEARNREGFAHGAIIAAEWLQGKQGFFTMSEMLSKGTII